MAYEPTTWVSTDLITADKLNKIENGIANAEGRSWTFQVPVSSWTTSNNQYIYSIPLENISSATWIEINLGNTGNYLTSDIFWSTSNDTLTLRTEALPSNDLSIAAVAWGTIGSTTNQGELMGAISALENRVDDIEDDISNYSGLPVTGGVSTSDYVAVDINGTKYKASLQTISNTIGGGGSQQNSLVYYTKNFGTISSLPATFNDSNITSSMIPIKVNFGDESVATWIWQVTCGNGTVTIDKRNDAPTGNTGIKENSSTTLEIVFGVSLAAAPSLITKLDSNTPANILDSNPQPGVTGILPVTNGGTGASTAVNARKNLDACAKEDLAIIIDGNTVNNAISAGQYAYIKNSTLSDGLYTANKDITASTAVSSEDFDIISNGGLNDIQQSLAIEDGDGYIKMPNGVLICWGIINIASLAANSYTEAHITFPMVFLSFPALVAIPLAWTDPNQLTCIVKSQFTSNGDLRVGNNGAAMDNVKYNWIAIGRWK